ncbi:ATP-binding protein [Rubellimicrobium rubrum]|uniref:ATP-binding protein n=1 Tax=Rubellimicrobium rubrum TaxID=2585369 RepID=A0A5C4MJE0_9RHOB|nr:ATP-binding protein [Rubellimicrobium rubrum]TNC45236.1 ATP-binding protein [Rubellimicrobium rubrum]
MQPIEIVPSPSALLKSLRGLGYSPETALADLVDNALASRARSIRIEFDWRDGDPLVELLDDGDGMSAALLVEAMRFGGAGPDATRSPGDLGRFGLGLKTASLSQCRRLVVSSRAGDEAGRLAWDVDAVEQAGSWKAEVPEHAPPGRLAAEFEKGGPGTLVSWTRMDPLGGLHGLDRAAFNARIADIRAHLAMTFHRFLAGEAKRIRMEVNGRALVAWDPFCRWHGASIAMPRDVIRGPGGAAIVQPFILPHRDRFESEQDYDDAGGPEGWGERQGFYVYRGDRLVSAGGWLGLGGARAWTREESSRLARIAVDLPTTSDAEWRIDVRKSTARPPHWARSRLVSVAAEVRRRAREIFVWRGGGRRRGPARAALAFDLWAAGTSDRPPRYRIDRGHPAVRALAGSTDPALLEGLLAALELTVPVERIWLDVSEEGGATRADPSDEDVRALAAPLAALVFAVDSGADVGARLDELLRSLGVDTPELRRAVLQELHR